MRQRSEVPRRDSRPLPVLLRNLRRTHHRRPSYRPTRPRMPPRRHRPHRRCTAWRRALRACRRRHDRVLTGRRHTDQRPARRSVGEQPQRACVDAIIGDHSQQSAGRVIVSDCAAECGACSRPRRGDSLIQTLATRVFGVARSEHRLTRTGEPIRRRDEIEVRAPDDADVETPRHGVDQPTLRARTPIGAIRRYPAAWRWSSDSPPQNPYSWLSRA